jgi:mRNA-degrading endonuclease RelE of RelBE toxin-antitoxin system
MNRILWQPKALRQLRKIKDESVQQQIFQEAQTLKEFPNCANVKRLTNHRYGYRLRIGSYRLFFDFQGGEARIVSIEEVKKRDSHTY